MIQIGVVEVTNRKVPQTMPSAAASHSIIIRRSSLSDR
jgi:hypothetical protein